jgi:hypothetical protein
LGMFDKIERENTYSTPAMDDLDCSKFTIPPRFRETGETLKNSSGLKVQDLKSWRRMIYCNNGRCNNIYTQSLPIL